MSRQTEHQRSVHGIAGFSDEDFDVEKSASPSRDASYLTPNQLISISSIMCSSEGSANNGTSMYGFEFAHAAVS